MFNPVDIAAIKQHALDAFPNEGCGAITPQGYTRLENLSETPLTAFDCTEAVGRLLIAARLLAVVHSHPGGPLWPTGADIAGSMGFDVPWGLCATDGERVSEPFFWGQGVAIPPLEGRTFRHGPSGTDGAGDCYALVRDYYRQELGILLPEGVRDWEWWTRKEGEGPRDLYRENFQRAGFKVSGADDPKVGDLVLMQIAAPKHNLVPNHAGIYIGGGMVLHHKTRRLSNREPLGPWIDSKRVTGWLRHVDA